ncbi:MAG: methionine adenosyltransferase, partial [Candidatus Bathyarchaeia archaeon]
ITLIVAGRAVTQVVRNGKISSVPIGTITLEAMKDFLRRNFRFLDVEKHVVCNYMIRQGSFDLIHNFESCLEMPLANDTSFGIGFAPLSETERIVYETEVYLNSTKVKKELPSVGEDIKVMGMRYRNRIDITVAAPQISSLTPDLDQYLSVKSEVRNRVLDLASKMTKREVNVSVNTEDDISRKVVYLTLTGTSAEGGDDGNTGRGNRVHGLITPCRPMSLEAVAGKNPVNHVGKIYNVLAGNMAHKICKETKGVREAYVKLLSQIGKPIDQPMMADVQVIIDKTSSLRAVETEIKSIVDDELSNIRKITEAILTRKITLY